MASQEEEKNSSSISMEDRVEENGHAAGIEEPQKELLKAGEVELPNKSHEDDECTSILDKVDKELTDDERQLLYEKGLQFYRLNSLSHALLCFLGCLKGLKPSAKSKFTMLPLCLSHVAEIYAKAGDYEKAVEFMQGAKLYYETAIIETGIQVDQYKKESSSRYQPIDLDPLLDEAKRANEYERLSNTCLEQRKFQLALEYCGKATKLRQEAYGDDHPYTVKSLDLFTLIYAEMGKKQYSEAMVKYGDIVKEINEKEQQKANKKGKLNNEEEHLSSTGDSIEKKSDTNNNSKTEQSSSSVRSHRNSTELEQTDVNSPEEVLDEKPPLDLDKNGKNDSVSVSTGCSSADTKIKKHVTFSKDTIDNEKTPTVKLITPLQFFVVCVISIIISVLATAVWCHLTDAPYCPSYDYLHIHGRYWYYYFFKTPDAVNSSFF